jgi:hypothetical protein
VTSEPPQPWDRPYPWEALQARIRIVPGRDEDKSEWIKTLLELRFWMRFLSNYSDLSKHGGVEWDAEAEEAKVVTYKPDEDAAEAIKYGDKDQYRAVMIQVHGETLGPLVPFPKRKRGGGKHHRLPGLDEAEDDFYFIRDILKDKYLEAGEKQLYRWYEDALGIVADFHGVEPDSLHNRMKR